MYRMLIQSCSATLFLSILLFIVMCWLDHNLPFFGLGPWAIIRGKAKLSIISRTKVFLDNIFLSKVRKFIKLTNFWTLAVRSSSNLPNRNGKTNNFEHCKGCVGMFEPFIRYYSQTIYIYRCCDKVRKLSRKPLAFSLPISGGSRILERGVPGLKDC